MIKLITFADSRMNLSATNCLLSAEQDGRVDRAIYYGPKDITIDFAEKMKAVLAHERGAGFYCWKPYFVYQAVKDMQDGDYLIWSDAGTTWLHDVRLLIEAMDEDALFFTNGFRHVEWCKMDCLATMAFEYPDGKSPKVKDAYLSVKDALQVQASHIIFKITEQTRSFIDMWYFWTLKGWTIDNEPSILPNCVGFKEHRWDQAILTNLQIEHGYKLHWFPSTMFMNDQWRRQPGDRYPAMFDHHRRRNWEW